MKNCPICGVPVAGRSDKLYCSPQCKNAASYDRFNKQEQFYKRVDRQLKINRKLLKKYNKDGFTTLRQDKLKREGFDPRFFTHYWKNAKGDVYLFCYDFGFLSIEHNGLKKYLLVLWQDYMSQSGADTKA